MGEIKFSAKLKEILEYAKVFAPPGGSEVTAEGFLMSLLHELQIAKEYSPEVAAAKQMLEQRKVDLSNLQKMLTDIIAKEMQRNEADEKYFARMLKEANESGKKGGEPFVTVGNVVECMLKDPNNVVNAVLGNVDESEADKLAKMKALREAFRKTLQEGHTEEEDEPDKPDATQQECEAPIQCETPAPDVKTRIDTLVHTIDDYRKELQSVIFGQDNAIRTFLNGYFQASLLAMTDKSRTKPRASFLFAGPPGVGKTFLAEQISRVTGLKLHRFDMSEYSNHEAAIEFCGSDNVYKNAKSGNVTEIIAKEPECILLFDEIEKAHISIIHLFLQMLDAGRIRDSKSDKELSLSKTIIIMTTNAGKQLYEDSESGDFSNVSRKVVIKALEKDVNPETGVPFFPSAICSRFASGNVVMFNRVSAHDLVGIAKKEVQRQAGNIEESSGIKIDIDENVYSALLFAEGGNADARTVRSRAEAFLNNEIYELLRLVASDKVNSTVQDIESIRVQLDLGNEDEEIVALFEMKEKARALVFSDENTVAQCRAKVPSCVWLGAKTTEEAERILNKEDIGFILVDLHTGITKEQANLLNIEDIQSLARDFMKYLREQSVAVPVYLLETDAYRLSEAEATSFMRQGLRGVLSLGEAAEAFKTRIDTLAKTMHQQECLTKLAMENKLITYETAQSISADGKHACIRLFDLNLAVSVDAEDGANMLTTATKPKEEFDDVIGADEAKEELKYFVNYLKDPKQYMGTGVKAPKGVLLYGPPGTGKTMLAKAMANEAGVTFLFAEGNQFLKRYLGEGAEAVHELFRKARKYAPSVLFIDEIDAIAKERKGDTGNGGDNGETLTAFLTEMDGFSNNPSKPVFVLAATNFDIQPGHPKSLDPALMRRFDRRVYVDLPNKQARIRFMNKKREESVALQISDEIIKNLALRSTGMSLADLDSMFELALRSAIRAGSKVVTDEILEEAFEVFNYGEEKAWDAAQLERVARHEAGHALLCYLSGETPAYLTVVARGNHGGYMQHADQEGKAIYTKEELLAQIRTSLGGRAAEIVYYGEKDGISTGASGDLASATARAERLLCHLGMDESFGLAVVSDAAIAGEMSSEVRAAVNGILDEQMQQAIRLIAENRDKMDVLVSNLLQRDNLTGAEIEALLGK